MLTTFFREEHESSARRCATGCRRRLAPHVDEWEKAELFPREVFKQAGELGFLGATTPRTSAARAATSGTRASGARSWSRSDCAGVNMALAGPVRHGDADHQRDRHATSRRTSSSSRRSRATRSRRSASASPTAAPTSRAHPHHRARRSATTTSSTARRCCITNGTRADFITLAVRTGERGHGGISLVLFPTDVKGFKVVARSSTRPATTPATPPSSSFEDCRIPARYLLGEENQGFYYMMTNFQGERLIAAVKAVAGAQWALDDTIRYAQRAHGVRPPDLQVPGVAPQVRRARHRDRSGALAHLPRGRPVQPQAGRGQGDHDGEAVRRRARSTRRSIAACRPTAASATPTSSPSRARGATSRLITIGGGTSEIMKEILSKRLGWG